MTSFGRKGLSSQTDGPAGAPAHSLPAVARYDITPHPMKMLLAVAFFGVGALVFFVKLGEPRGLLINHSIELSPNQADIFFAALVLASIAMSSMALVGLFRSFGPKVYVTLDSHAVSGPCGYATNRIIRLPFGAIKAIKIKRIRDQEFIVIVAGDGRTIKVGSANFRIKPEWQAFSTELRSRLATMHVSRY